MMDEVLQFSPEAQADVRHATLSYEDCLLGLGDRFKNELRDATDSITLNPLIRRKRKGDYRRANMRTFPYYIIYILNGDSILIITVAHSSRHPDFWKSRIL